MNSKTIIVGTAVMGAAALLGGCHKGAPAGQVVATVNGEEVTQQEVNAELQAANVPSTADTKAAQRELLQRVIDRKLIVDAAKEKGIDKTPEYQTQRRRADELLLAQIYAKQQLSAVPVPTAAEVQKFMADHPNVFAQREALTLDQIRFPTPADPNKLKVLEKDHSLEAVAQTLTGLGIKFERSQVGLDSGAVPSDVMDKINHLPPTEPFVVPQPTFMTVNVVLSRKPLPVDEAKARPAAVNAWRQQKFGELLTKQVEALRSGAKVSYQNGFGPAATPPKPAVPAKP